MRVVHGNTAHLWCILLCSSSLLLGACGGGDEDIDTPSAGADSVSVEEVHRSEAEALALASTDEETLSAPERAKTQAAAVGLLKSFAAWTLELPVNDSGALSGTAHSLPVSQVIAGKAPPFVKTYFAEQSKELVFHAPVKGAQTPNAGGPRSELKETQGTRWNPRSGMHSMTLNQKLSETPKGTSPRVVIGQVHDEEENLILVKYYGPKNANGSSDTGTIQVEFNHSSSAWSKTYTLDGKYKLTTPFEVSIRIQNNKGYVSYSKNGMGTPVSFEQTLYPQGATAYFKVGAYTQKGSPDQKLSGRSKVIVSTATIEHK